MAAKKRRKKQPNLQSRIVSLVMERGPMKLGTMVKALDAPYQSLNTEALELRKHGVLQKDTDGVWSLVPGIDPETFGIKVTASDKVSSRGKVSVPAVPSTSDEFGLSLKERFFRVLVGVGVKKIDPASLADHFFNGEINDLKWLYQVLMVDAKGFVTEGQAKFIMARWAQIYGIPYRFEDFFED